MSDEEKELTSKEISELDIEQTLTDAKSFLSTLKTMGLGSKKNSFTYEKALLTLEITEKVAGVISVLSFINSLEHNEELQTLKDEMALRVLKIQERILTHLE